MTLDLKPLTATQQVISLALKNQDNLKKVSIQISSGFKNPDFKGFAVDGTTEQFVALKETVNNLEAFQRSNTLAISRAKTSDEVISSIQDIASSFAELLARRRNDASGDHIPLESEAYSALDNIAGKLNIKFDGRYLFAGSKTNTKPISDLSSSTLNADDTPNASYYSGDSDAPSVRASETQTINYGVTANEDAFQELIGAIHLAIKANTNDSDIQFSSAIDMLNSSVEKLASVRSKVVSAVDNLEGINVQHGNSNVFISENLTKISQTDIVEATTRMSELEAIVQASYLAFNRISNLRLSNFLQ